MNLNRKKCVALIFINKIGLINLLGDLPNISMQNKTFKNQNKEVASNFNEIEIVFVFN